MLLQLAAKLRPFFLKFYYNYLGLGFYRQSSVVHGHLDIRRSCELDHLYGTVCWVPIKVGHTVAGECTVSSGDCAQ